MMTKKTLKGAMQESIPTRRLRAARDAYEATRDERPWHMLSALEQQLWIDRTPMPKV